MTLKLPVRNLGTQQQLGQMEFHLYYLRHVVMSSALLCIISGDWGDTCGSASGSYILCEKTFTSYTTFRSHKYEHSNWDKESNTYTCKDCKFVSKSKRTYLVHIGKSHSQPYECGICNSEFKTSEDIETHLSTCEVYRCKSCGKKEMTISDIMNHSKYNIIIQLHLTI